MSVDELWKTCVSIILCLIFIAVLGLHERLKK